MARTASRRTESSPPRARAVTRSAPATVSAARDEMAPEATGRVRFTGCSRSASWSSTSFTRYMAADTATNSTAAAVARRSGVARSTTPAAAGAAYTSRFFVHWRGLVATSTLRRANRCRSGACRGGGSLPAGVARAGAGGTRSTTVASSSPACRPSVIPRASSPPVRCRRRPGSQPRRSSAESYDPAPARTGAPRERSGRLPRHRGAGPQGSVLAAGAAVGRARSDDDAPEGGAAARAGRSGTAVDAMAGLVAAELSHEVAVAGVPQRGAAHLDGPAQYPAGGACESGDLCARQALAGPAREHAGGVADLVCVEAADAGDHRLVGEGSLERRPSACQALGEARGAEPVAERVGSEPVELGRQAVAADLAGHEPLPEGPRIDKAQLAPVVEPDHDVGVGLEGEPGGLGYVEQLAAHPQVDDHHLAVVEDEGEVLTPPVRPDEAPAGHPEPELGSGLSADRPAAGDREALDSPARQHGLEPAPDGLHLGQLGHGWRPPDQPRAGRASPGAGTPSTVPSAAARARSAPLAASRSATFFDLPAPIPSSRPETTAVASNC